MIPDFKVRVNPEESADIQRLVFQLGGMWAGSQDTVVKHTDRPFLLFTLGGLSNLTATHEVNFIQNSKPEYSVYRLKTMLLSILERERENMIPDFKVKVNRQQSIEIQTLLKNLGGIEDVLSPLLNEEYLFYKGLKKKTQCFSVGMNFFLVKLTLDFPFIMFNNTYITKMLKSFEI